MKKILMLAMVVGLSSGCVEGTYQHSSTHYFYKSLPPSKYKAFVIGDPGPQLEPEYYEILGTVSSEVVKIKKSEIGCTLAIYLLQSEAENHGADALIHTNCLVEMRTARGTGIAIIFKNRYESLKRLEEIGAKVKRYN